MVSLTATWLHRSRLYGDQPARNDQTGGKREWGADGWLPSVLVVWWEEPRFRIQASSFISLCLSFLVYKKGTVVPVFLTGLWCR